MKIRPVFRNTSAEIVQESNSGQRCVTLANELAPPKASVSFATESEQIPVCPEDEMGNVHRMCLTNITFLPLPFPYFSVLLGIASELILITPRALD